MGSSQSKLDSPDEATIALWQLLIKSITKPTTPAKVTTMLAARAEVYGRPSSIPASQSKTMVQHAEDSLLKQTGREAAVVQTVEAVIRLLKEHVNASLRQAIHAGDDRKFNLLSPPEVGGDLSQPSSSPFGLLGLAVQSPAISVGILSSLTAVPANKGWILTILPDGSSLYSYSSGAAKSLVLKAINSQVCTLPLVQPNDAASVALIKRLKERGIPVDLQWKDGGGNTLLHHAALAHQGNLLRYLTSDAVGVDTQIRNNDGHTALMLLQAQSNASPEMIRLLGVVQENNGLARLIRREGANVTLEAMNPFITRGAEVNSRESGRTMPLHLLVQHGVPAPVIQRFIEQHTAQLEATDENGMRAVDLVVLRDDDTKTLEMLLEKGARLHNPTLQRTLYSLADTNNKVKAAALIRARASLSLWKTLQSCTPQCATPEQLTAVRDQFALGADREYVYADAEYQQGITFLAFVSINGHVSLVDEMVRVRKLVDVAFAGPDGMTGLLAAASAGRLDLLHYYRINLNQMLTAQNKEGESALHLATKGRHIYVVQWLIDNGVDASLKTVKGRTALDLAMEQPSADNQQYQNAVSQGWDDKQQLALVRKLTAVDYGRTFDTTTEDALVRSMAPPAPGDVRADVCVPAQQPSAPDLPPVEEINEGTVPSLRLRLDAWRTANKRLRSAAEKGNLEDVKKQIGDEQADIRALDDRRKSAYIVALESAVKHDNQANTIQLRDPKEAGIQREKAMRCREVAQHLAVVALVGLRDAVIKQNAAAVRSYLELGASPADPELVSLCVRNAKANPASDTAAPAILRRLLELAPSHLAMLTTRQTDTGMTLYQTAVQNNHPVLPTYMRNRLSAQLAAEVAINNKDNVLMLLAAGAVADIECADEQRNTAVAMRLGNHELFALLVKHGARLPVTATSIVLPNTLSEEKRDAFRLYVDRLVLQQQCRLAAARGDLAAVTSCHQRGANLNARNYWGGTALSATLQYGSYLRVVHYLVSRNASVLHGHAESRMSSVIQHCINKRYPDRLRLYLEQTVNLQMQRAVVEGNREMRDALGGIGKNWWQYKDVNGNNAVHLAIQSGREPEWLQWLCNSGCSLQEANNAGDYAIHEAARRADNGSIDFITKRDGTTKELTNAKGKTAFELAKDLQYFHVASQLDTDFVKPEEAEEMKYTGPPKYNEQQLIRAAAAPNMPVIHEFIEQQYLNIQAKADICRKMLAAATSRKQSEAMAVLKKHLDYLDRHSPVQLDPMGHIAFHTLIHNVKKAMLPSELQSVMDESQGYNKMWSRMVELRQKDEPALSAPINEAEALKTMEAGASKDRERASLLAEQLESVRETEQKYWREQQEAREQLIRLQTEHRMMDRLLALQQNVQQNVEETRKNAAEMLKLAAQVEALQDRTASLESARKVIDQERKEKLLEAERKDWVKAQGPSVLHFYNTVQMFLEGFIFAVASNQCGVLVSNVSGASLLQKSVITIATTMAAHIPLVGSFVQSVVAKGGEMYVTGINKRRQMEEAATMSALGSRVELITAIGDASYLITRFYFAQLKSLPEDQGKPAQDRACFLLAMYGCTVITSSMSRLQPLPFPALPLGQRMWLVLASLSADEPTLVRRMQDRIDDTGASKLAGQQLSPGSNTIIIRSGHTVRLRDIFLAVMLKTKDGGMYAPRGGDELAASAHCGYVSTATIVSRTDIDAYIIKQRELTPIAAPHDVSGMDETSSAEPSTRLEGELVSPTWGSSGSSSGFSTPRRDESQRWTPTTEDMALEVQALLEKNGSLMTTQRAEELIHDEKHSRTEVMVAALASMKAEMDSSRYLQQATIDEAASSMREASKALQAKQSKDIATHKQQLHDYTALEDSKFDGRLSQMTKLHEATLKTAMDTVALQMRQLSDRHQQQMEQLQQAHIAASNRMMQEHQTTVRAIEKQITEAQQSAVAAQAETASMAASFEEQKREFAARVAQWNGSFSKLLTDGNAAIGAANTSLNESKMMHLASMTQATETHQRAMADQRRMADSARELSQQAAAQSAAAQTETRKAKEEMERQRREATTELERQRREAAAEMERLRRAGAEELGRLNTAMIRDAEQHRRLIRQANDQATASAREAERATRDLVGRVPAR